MDVDAYERIARAKDSHYPDADPEEFVQHALTDLRHYCDANGLDMGRIDREAYDAYCREHGAYSRGHGG